MKSVSRLKNVSSYESLNLQIAEPLTENRSAERRGKINEWEKSWRKIRSELIKLYRLVGAKQQFHG